MACAAADIGPAIGPQRPLFGAGRQVQNIGMLSAERAGAAPRVASLVERLSGLPLRWQIGALVVLGLTGIFVLFGLLGSAIADDAKQRTINEWVSITTSTASFIDSEIDARSERLLRVATLVAGAHDPARRRAVLEDAFGRPEPLLGGAFLLDRDGATVWASAGLEPRDLAADPSVSEPLTTGARYVSGVHRVGTEVGAIVAVPVREPGGRTLGVLGVVIRPDQGVIHDMVSSARGLAHTGHAQLVDQFDRVVASSEPEDVLGPGEHPELYEPLLAERRSAVGLTAPVGASDPVHQGQRHVMAFVPLRTVPWGLALGGSDAELSADASRWQQQLVLFGGLSLALALLLVWLTTRSVARPILALAAASRKIADGDLATPVPRGGEGEVRVLAQAFDHMRGELQSALSALALEKSRYEGIVASMADAVVTTDPTLRITAFNPAASALTGWRIDEAIGRRCDEVISSAHASPSDRPAPSAPLAPELDPGVSKGTLRRRDGREVEVAITRSAIRDDAGRLAGIVHVLRDISAEQEVDRLKEQFLSTVSHELRTPLGFIMGYATTLLLPDAPDDTGEVRRCIEVIAEASCELGGLVDDLLDMAKIGAGSLSVAPSRVRIDPLVRAAVERLRVRGERHRFVTAVPASLPPLWADAHRLEQVLYDLLDNAIKYSPEGGRISVRASATAGEVLVSVVDEGLGVPPEELPMLFERFHRGRVARDRGIAGTGLGLAICKGIVEAHGGRIWAESPPTDGGSGPPHGTAIRFTVPVAAAEVAA